MSSINAEDSTLPGYTSIDVTEELERRRNTPEARETRYNMYMLRCYWYICVGFIFCIFLTLFFIHYNDIVHCERTLCKLLDEENIYEYIEDKSLVKELKGIKATICSHFIL